MILLTISHFRLVDSSITPKRVTRSQTVTPQTGMSQARRALEELQRPTQQVEVDEERLHTLLDFTVSVTEGFNVENLERVYSVLSQNVYRHRHSYDKSQLVEVRKKLFTWCLEISLGYDSVLCLH